jgi:RNA polymerase nonessential primary-like sigma factor
VQQDEHSLKTAATPSTKRPSKGERISNGGKVDLIGLYLDDAARHALLTPEREKELGEVIQAGLAAQEALDGGEKLPAAEKRKLQKAVRDGRQAEHDFVVANLRLVVSIAKRYVRGGRHDLKELVQYGNFGLLHAVRKFDPQKGFKFSTYATWWVKQAITRGLAGEDVVYVPSRVIEERNFLLHVRDELNVSLQRTPSWKEIAKVTGIPENRVREVLSLDSQPVSLSTPISSNGEGEETIADVVPWKDEDLERVDFLHGAEMVIRKIFKHLSAQEQRVMVALYGLDGREPMTMGQISVEEGLTKDQVRLMVGRISTRVRHPATGIIQLVGDVLHSS